MKFTCTVFLLGACTIASGIAPSFSAENLRMREGVSYFHDLDQGFPLVADKMDDVCLAQGHPTLVFFGAAGDLNTNRQARRVVDLYKKYRAGQVKFVIIDVDHAQSPDARQMMKSHYPGYIPATVLFDKQGKSKWNQTGEVELGLIASQLEKLL